MFSKITKMDQMIREIRPKPIPSVLPDTSSDKEAGTQKLSYLGPTGHLKGDILLDEDLRIEGEVEGTITIRGKQLNIGERALVKGEIHASTIRVRGTVEGDVYGDELVHVYAKAEITGSIYCKRIVVEDGARFNGLFRTSKEASKPSASKRTAKLSESKRPAKLSDSKSTLRSVSG